jgi:diacylglycerol kinase (ATP)
MRVLLIYNPNAGDGVHDSLRELVDLIHAAGHEVRCRSSKDPLIASAFAEPADLVAVAGGDGTIVKVARLLRGRRTAIAPLPLGTANNISTALGLMASSLEDSILGWNGGRTVLLDIGIVRSPRGSRSFLESFGIGLLPRLMASENRRERAGTAANADARLAGALTELRRAAQRSPRIAVTAELDGQDVSGRYILFEAMNIGWVGPNVNLASDADPEDGLLDLVLVAEDDRALLLECLDARERDAAWPHALRTLRGHSLRIAPADFAFHVDDELWPDERSGDSEARTVEVSLRDKVSFLVPPSSGKTHRPRRAPLLRKDTQRRPGVTPSRWGWPAGRQARFRR